MWIPPQDHDTQSHLFLFSAGEGGDAINWATLHTNMPTLAAAAFAAYVAVMALLVSLAISRHDKIFPVGSAIMGRRFLNVSMIVLEVIALGAAELGASLRLTVPLELTAILAILSVLSRAVSVAVDPSVFDVQGRVSALRDVERSVRKLLHRWTSRDQGLEGKVCMRGQVDANTLASANPSLTSRMSSGEGVVVYRQWFAKILSGLNGSRALTDKAWLAWREGEVVHDGDPLCYGTSGTLRFFIAKRTLKILPLDTTRWQRLRNMIETASYTGDRVTFEHAMDVLVHACRALRHMHPNGPLFAELWPSVAGFGCPEAFLIGDAYASLIRRLSARGHSQDAGDAVIRLVSSAVDRPELTEAAQAILHFSREATPEFDAAQLGILLLRQRYFELDARRLGMWTTFADLFLSPAKSIVDVTEWLYRGKTLPAQLQGNPSDPNLIGALVVLADCEANQIAGQYVNQTAHNTAQRIRIIQSPGTDGPQP